jgi:hypothetical protein
MEAVTSQPSRSSAGAPVKASHAIASASATSWHRPPSRPSPAHSRHPGDARRQARPRRWQSRTDQPAHARSRHGPFPGHASRRGAASSAAPGTASSPWWPAPSARLHDHMPPLNCPIPGVTIPAGLTATRQWSPFPWPAWSRLGPGPVTQPARGWCPLWCGGSKNTVCRNSSWHLLQATRTCPMPRPRPAASRAGPHRHGFQLTCALPGHN